MPYDVASLEAGLFNFDNTPETIGPVLGLDLAAQLRAIKNLIRRNQEAIKELDLEIDSLQKEAQQATYEPGSLEETIWEETIQDGPWINRMHDGDYQSAAHSMAAAAMLAPFVEILFVRIFKHIGDEYAPQADSNDKRSQASRERFWDPHLVFTRKGQNKNPPKGIKQLADYTGLAEFLPDDYHKIVEVLFRYRNKMFHLGLEWPDEGERDSQWPEAWFTKVDHYSNSPMVIMNDEFIEHCLKTIDGVVAGLCKFRLAKYEDGGAASMGTTADRTCKPLE